MKKIARRRSGTCGRIVAALLTVGLGLCSTSPAHAQSSFSVGLDYWSDYFWRGFSFYGDEDSARGVFFPSLGYTWKDLSFSIVGELPEAIVTGNANDTERAWAGVDFILSHSMPLFDEALRVGSRASYFLYPNSPSENADDARNDFVELALWFQIDALPLDPKLEYSHYFRIDDRDGEQDAYEDIYLRFSLRQSFEPLDHLTLTARASVAYFWYPSSKYWNDPAVGGYGDDYEGLSDLVATLEIATDVWSQFTPHAALNVAYVPDQDFRRVWGRDQRVHVWVAVGISYHWPIEDF